MKSFIVMTLCIVLACTGCAAAWKATSDAAEQWWVEKGREKVQSIALDAAKSALEGAEGAMVAYVDKKVVDMEAKLVSAGVDIKNLDTPTGVLAEIAKIKADYETKLENHKQEMKEYAAKVERGEPAEKPEEPTNWIPTAGLAVVYALVQLGKRGATKEMKAQMQAILKSLAKP